MPIAGATYEYQPSFILGFHGCDKVIGEKILRTKGQHLNKSEKLFDWLGHGIYFWEGSPSRAMDWAESKKKAGDIKTPFVLGAILDLGHCLDLFDLSAMAQVKQAHKAVVESMSSAGLAMPTNVGPTPDKGGRKLDCAVLNMLHTLRKDNSQDAYDSVRGPFLEGNPVYPDAGFRDYSHIQICVCNDACIKGYFRPL